MHTLGAIFFFLTLCACHMLNVSFVDGKNYLEND